MSEWSPAEDFVANNVQPIYPDQLVRSDKGVPLDRLANIVKILRGDPAFAEALAFDEFSNRLLKMRPMPWETTAGEWSDVDSLLLQVYLTDRGLGEYSLGKISAAIIAVAKARAFHPVREYLSGLQWDGQERLNLWLAHYLGVVGIEDELRRAYVDRVGKMWLVAAVHRVMEPGCKFDNVLILEGSQGIGKSTALQILAGEWYTDTPFPMGDKDGFQALAGVWIVELAELEAFTSVESSRSKSFFSSAIDRYRPSYGARTMPFPRQCVIAGSTNRAEYLKDATGNRRYWPVMCTQVRLDDLRADRDQLWAEAVHLYLAGYAHYVSPTDPLAGTFHAMQSERQIDDPWEYAIALYLEDYAVRNGMDVPLTSLDILRGLGLDVRAIDQRGMAQRVGKAMQKLGWTKKRGSSREDRRLGRAYYTRVSPLAEKG